MSRTLETLARAINKATGSPLEPYGPPIDGKCQPNGGCYHISGAYGGYALHRMADTGTAIRDVFNSGHISSRQLAKKMREFLAGYSAAKEDYCERIHSIR